MRTTILALAVVGIAATALAALQGSGSPPPNLERALAAQEALVAERPNDPLVLNDLGNLLLVVGRTSEAEEAYRRALEVAPEMASAHYNLGLLLLQRTEDAAALGQFRAVLDAEPEHAWAHYQVGAILDRRGAERKALKHYTRAFRLDPQLAFPEINPHVIDNAHVTQALLLAYRDLPSSAQAPKTYEDPARIVSLMLAAEQAGAEDAAETMEELEPMQGEEMEPELPGAVDRTGPASIPPVSIEGEEDGGEEGSGGRVLRQEDLEEDGSLNQATPQGSVYYRPQGGVRSSPRNVRERYQPPTSRRPPGSTRETTRPTPSTPPPGRERFTPGIPSSGRLEIELLPGPGGDDDPAAAG